MKKLTQLIGGSAIAITLMAMTGGMNAKAMGEQGKTTMLRAPQMGPDIMQPVVKNNTMNPVGYKIKG
jgi:hypothetical protein